MFIESMVTFISYLPIMKNSKASSLYSFSTDAMAREALSLYSDELTKTFKQVGYNKHKALCLSKFARCPTWLLAEKVMKFCQQVIPSTTYCSYQIIFLQ